MPFALSLSKGVSGGTRFDELSTNGRGGADCAADVLEGRVARTFPSVPRPTSGRRHASARGFTLVEIMVALVVFSLAALALIRLEGQTIRSTGIVSATLLAQIVARNVAIEAVTDEQPPVRGRVSGVEQAGGRSWTWTREVQPLGDGDVQRIDVAVGDGGGAVLGRATMVRPPPAPIQTQIGQSVGGDGQAGVGQPGSGGIGQGS